MTLSQLAKLAHVSTSTVSKAFSMSGEVNEQTRDMIFEVAKKHGCFKQFYREEYSGLVIAIICPEFNSTYYSRFISEMQKLLSESSCSTCVASTDFSRECERRLIEYYERYHTVDGIVLINGHSGDLGKSDIPIATVNCFGGTKGVINVEKRTGEAVTEAIDKWIENGITDIGFIGEKHTGSRKRMVSGIIKKRLGKVNEDFFAVTEERFEEGGYLAMTRLIDSGKLPRAIVCAYDRFAFGAMRALSDRGISVPDEVAVLGIDDAPQSAYLSPALSSVNHEIELTCRKVAEALLNKINGEPYKSEINISPSLKVRESFGVK